MAYCLRASNPELTRFSRCHPYQAPPECQNAMGAWYFPNFVERSEGYSPLISGIMLQNLIWRSYFDKRKGENFIITKIHS